MERKEWTKEVEVSVPAEKRNCKEVEVSVPTEKRNCKEVEVPVPTEKIGGSNPQRKKEKKRIRKGKRY